MEALTGAYNFTRLESVTFGPDSLAAVSRELERRGLTRAIVITGRTLGHSRMLDHLKQALGPKLAGVFTGARQHVPSATVAAAATEVERAGADCLISFGGGSPIDTAKAAAMKILSARDQDAKTARAANELVHIAIPTTLSAGEFTPFGGVTDEGTRRKGGVRRSPLAAQGRHSGSGADAARTPGVAMGVHRNQGARPRDRSELLHAPSVGDRYARRARDCAARRPSAALDARPTAPTSWPIAAAASSRRGSRSSVRSTRGLGFPMRWAIRLARAGTCRMASRHVSRCRM